MDVFHVCRYAQATTGMKTYHETSPIQTSCCNEEFIVLATTGREYYIYLDKEKFVEPSQETYSFVSTELVF